MNRRNFLKFSSAGIASAMLGTAGLITWVPRAQAATISKTFYITEGFITQPDGANVYFRGFSSSTNSLNTPGEHIIAQEGDTIDITIVNTLGTSHSFVVDGMVDSGRIRGGETRRIQFTAQNPGSYLYYDARNAPYNRVTGLHGGLAVMPSGSPDQLYSGSNTFSQQYFWIFNESDPAWNNAVRNGQTPPSSYTPMYFTINGLNGRPPGSAGSGDPHIDSMHDHRSALHGHLGDRTLVRCLNAGMVQHAVHTHANHMEWLASNGQPRPDVWLKDIVPLDGNGGSTDVIYPFEPAPDAWPPMTNATIQQAVNQGRKTAYPMHLHNEMTQTAGGGLYMFGALTDIFYEPN